MQLDVCPETMPYPLCFRASQTTLLQNSDAPYFSLTVSRHWCRKPTGYDFYLELFWML